MSSKSVVAAEGAEYLTVRQAATVLGLSVDWVYRLVAKRRIPHVLLGSRVRISRAELGEWVENQRRGEVEEEGAIPKPRPAADGLSPAERLLAALEGAGKS